jgi:sigma-B regulation protein RsbU (phosphoserine phosphatase)
MALRVQGRQGPPAGVLLLENVRANGVVPRSGAQRLQKLVEQSTAYLTQASPQQTQQAPHANGAGHTAALDLSGENLRALAAWSYDVAGASRPSGTVGGDYLEMLALDESELAIAIGDVAGKGVAAAKMRDRLQASLRLHVLYESRLEALAEGLNQLVYAMSATAAFTTLFLGALNLQRGVLRYLNAGHNPGVMIHPSTSTPRFELLHSSGAALGVLEHNAMAEKRIALPMGATLIFYTDGVTEATGADGRQYGLTRLIECVTAGVFSGENFSAARLLRHVLEDLPYSAALAAGVAQPQDDQSVLIVVHGKAKNTGEK